MWVRGWDLGRGICVVRVCCWWWRGGWVWVGTVGSRGGPRRAGVRLCGRGSRRLAGASLLRASLLIVLSTLHALRARGSGPLTHALIECTGWPTPGPAPTGSQWLALRWNPCTHSTARLPLFKLCTSLARLAHPPFTERPPLALPHAAPHAPLLQ